MFHHGITYSGHSAACAAAMANLDILEGEDLPAAARSMEDELAATLEPLADSPLVREVRAGIGLLAGVQMEDPAHSPQLAEACLDAGVILRPIANGTLQISPPLTIDSGDLELLGRVLAAEIERLG
jgi:adenosylmethionine-8-amino-7-oxononanoate aminotransferase